MELLLETYINIIIPLTVAVLVSMFILLILLKKFNIFRNLDMSYKSIIIDAVGVACGVQLISTMCMIITYFIYPI